MEKKSKYDTNPLDPDVARRTDDVWGATRSTAGAPEAAETDDVTGATRDINRTPQQQAREDLGSEAPTRRYDEPKFHTSYPSVFVPPVYEPPTARGAASGIHGDASAAPPAQGATANQPPTSRPVANIKMPENIVLMAPYLPFPFVGAVIACVLLYLVPRIEPRVRFHAAQGLALHIIVLAVSVLTGMAEDFMPGSSRWMLTIASAAFNIMAAIFFIVSMIRVYKGEPHVVTLINDLTRFLNEKIEPRK
ncbi:MAG: hypothetical protein ICV60_06640 [Pyrinomonadaceae bacterium]|nr:hypothetical protein [Pyrinomonadaceae bacterium]